jgi:hypothetical protein
MNLLLKEIRHKLLVFVPALFAISSHHDLLPPLAQ